jgi:MFS family permease
MLLTAMVARLPQGMSGLAILLLLTRHVGYGRAGLATGVEVASAGFSSVALARGVDRFGARKVLIPAAVTYAALMSVLAGVDGRPYGAALVLCGGIGLATPPITSVSRGTWTRMLGPERAQVIYGLEATAQELVYIVGPSMVALVAGLANPQAAVVTSAGLGLAGVLAYATAPPLRKSQPRAAERRRSILFGTGLIWYALVGVCVTIGLNMTDIATVDFVSGRKASAAAGIVLAVWSAGSMVGGVWFGARSTTVTDRNLGAIVVVAGLGISAASLAPDAVGLGVILFIGGAAVAPSMARLYSRIGAVAPEGASTEAFGWLAVGFLAGSSTGSALGGLTVAHLGARAAFALAGAAAASAAVVIAVGSRRTRTR